MRQLEAFLLSYLLNSLWQVPLLLAAGWLVTRMLHRAGSAVEHRIWVTVLLLQCLLPAFSLLPWEWLQSLPLWIGHAGKSGDPQVSITLGPGTGLGSFQLPAGLLMTIVYAMVSAWFAVRFLRRNLAIVALRREAVSAVLSREATEYWMRCSRRFAIIHVSIAASARITGPVTMGVRRKLVLLPLGMIETLAEEDLHTVLAHEFAHIHRQDFVKNLMYEWLSLPVAYHPSLWFTRARIMESREMICDEMAADMNGQDNYARSLLRLARLLVEGAHAVTPHTIGIFDANTFERRIMNLTEKRKEPRCIGRIALIAASALFGLGVSASAIALAVHVYPVAAADNSGSKAPRQLTVKADVMAGNVLSKAVPIYPPDAKKTKIQGTVVLSVVIDKEGIVQNVKAVSGPPELQRSAIDAVIQWKYKPYLLNGDPIEVLTTINIIYSLKG